MVQNTAHLEASCMPPKTAEIADRWRRSVIVVVILLLCLLVWLTLAHPIPRIRAAVFALKSKGQQSPNGSPDADRQAAEDGATTLCDAADALQKVQPSVRQTYLEDFIRVLSLSLKPLSVRVYQPTTPNEGGTEVPRIWRDLETKFKWEVKTTQSPEELAGGPVALTRIENVGGAEQLSALGIAVGGREDGTAKGIVRPFVFSITFANKTSAMVRRGVYGVLTGSQYVLDMHGELGAVAWRTCQGVVERARMPHVDFAVAFVDEVTGIGLANEE